MSSYFTWYERTSFPMNVWCQHAKYVEVYIYPIHTNIPVGVLVDSLNDLAGDPVGGISSAVHGVDAQSSPVAHYKFNGDYQDSSGNNHHLTNEGSVIVLPDIPVDWRPLNFSAGSAQFPNSINPYSIYNGNGITFSFWIKTRSTPIWSRILEIQSGTNVNNGIQILMSDSDYLAIAIGNVPTIVYYPLRLDTNNWQHIIFSITSAGVWSL